MASAALKIMDSGLRWKRTYTRPGTLARKVVHADCDVDDGVYRLRRERKSLYRLSWIPRRGDQLGEEIDLGGYRYRRDCDERLIRHRATGR